jgi:predicted dehydrogenase
VSERLGVAVAGCGNIAGRYAEDIGRQPHLRLVGVTDLDAERAQSLAREAGTRAYGSLDEAVADDEVAIVVNLTSHHAHVPVSMAALEAGRHVFSEKPLALRADEAQALVELAGARGVLLGAAPIVGLGELAQTARRWVVDGRLGTVRLAWADVNWGRIEAWHPSPAAFYAVGPLYDVGVYPITLLTGWFGPVRRVVADHRRVLVERRTSAGEAFTVGAPDYVVASLELAGGPMVRLTANFYVADPARQRGIELHGDAGSLWISNWFQFGGSIEHSPAGEPYAPVPLLREPEAVMPWAAGVEELALAVLEQRPPRVSGEHAAHVVDVLETILRAGDAGRALTVASSFTPPAPPEWAQSLPLP